MFSFKGFTSAGYAPVADAAGAEEGLATDPPRPGVAAASKHARKAFWIAVLAVSLCANLAMLFVLSRGPSAKQCIRKVSWPSPLLAQARIDTLAPTTIDGRLWDNTSIWRQPPSAAVDAAWDRITGEKFQLVTVSAADVRRAGKDPRTAVRAPAAWGRGADAYIAQVEVFHQIHCLNELRKLAHHEYYYRHNQAATATAAAAGLAGSHRDHCVHVLLQALMCAADVGIIAHEWVHDEGYAEPKTRPFPDFSTNKKCRDFDALVVWLETGGGVSGLQDKLPMAVPADAPVRDSKGYSVG